MSNLIKTNVPGLYKDINTGVFINTNEYVKTSKKQRPDKEIIVLKNEIGSIKNELNDIKNLLTQLVNGKN